MTTCDLMYGPTSDSTKTHVISKFLPHHRTFNIFPLEPARSYWFTMMCQDNTHIIHYSNKILFNTGQYSGLHRYLLEGDGT